MTIPKKYLEIFYKTLSKTEPVLSEARIRDAFLKNVAEKTDEFYKDRTKVFETFCVKKEDGTPDIKNDQYTFDKEVHDDLNKEYNVLIEETVEFNPNPKIKKIVEGTIYGFKAGEVEIFDELMKLI